MRRVGWLSLVFLSLATPLAAQQPGGWQVVLDSTARVTPAKPAPARPYRFTEMPPGFHVTMGPGALLYAPDNEAGGRFRLEAQIFLFPGTSDEGYGLFIGGTNLDKGEPAYTAFLLRRSGEAGVIRQDGERTTVYLPWTRPDSVNLQQGDGVAGNVLAIVAGDDSVWFKVNGRPIGGVPRSLAPLEGIFGYRVGPGLDVHAATLDYTRHIAPARKPSGE